MGKVITQSQLRQSLQTTKSKQVVFTNGCFDILHVGHLRYLQKARTLGEILVVGINSDTSVKRLKGPSRPIVSQDERAEMLAGLECVDYVTIFEEDTPQKLIEFIAPDILVKGGDWPIEKIVGGDFVIKNGGKVLSLDLVEGRSTTNIVEKILKN